MAVVPRLGGADELSDAKAQAAQLQSELQQTGQRIDALSQQYLSAQIQKKQIDGQIQVTQGKIASTKQQIGHDQSVLRKAAVYAYVSAGAGASQDPLFTGNQAQQSAAGVYTSVAQGDVSVAVSNLNTATNQLNVQEATLQTQDNQAQAAIQAANAAQQQAQGLEAQQQANLDKVNGQIAQIIQQQQAAALAAAQAAARQQQAQQEAAAQAASQAAAQAPAARATAAASGGGASNPVSNVPVPPNTAGGAAVAAAESQLGVPYVYAAESPGVGFDCSGLTAWAWGQAGVSLPHFSGGQMSASTPVPVSQLEPGDLLFYGAGGGDHVAMYVSPGTMIEAPYTGADVRLTALRLDSGFAGAGRP